MSLIALSKLKFPQQRYLYRFLASDAASKYTKIYVAGLGSDAKVEDLIELFKPFSPVFPVLFRLQGTNSYTGNGQISVPAEKADSAIRKLDALEYKNGHLRVRIYEDRPAVGYSDMRKNNGRRLSYSDSDFDI